MELEVAIVMDDSVYDAGLAQKSVKKGTQIMVQSAFVLDDDSPVEVEVSELISFSDEVAKKTYQVQ